MHAHARTRTHVSTQVFAVLREQDAQEAYEEFKAAVASADDIQLNTPASNECRQLFQQATAIRQVCLSCMHAVCGMHVCGRELVLARAHARMHAMRMRSHVSVFFCDDWLCVWYLFCCCVCC